jgi:DNA processing protein
MNARRDWLRLATLPGIGPVAQRRLLKAFGGPAEVFAAGEAAWRRLLGDKASAVDAREASERFEAALAWIDEGRDRWIFCLGDDSYPGSLLDLSDPPCILFCVGDPGLLSRSALAIVGSRTASTGGERNAEQFATDLSRIGIAIVSGLALGIDAAAHRGGLLGSGSTIAVLGTGPDRVYPSRNRQLAHEIAEKGLLLTEFPPGVPPVAGNFPRRNRLIAALAKGVLVVEAAVESGSLITARQAGDLGREVFAVPGSIHSPQSRGCHQLIREGAKLVETTDDILVELGWTTQVPRGERAVARDSETPEGRQVLAAMGHDPRSVDQICASVGLTGDAVLAILLELELAGRVFVRPGGYFERSD